jgi:hypothetical protein
LCKEKVFKNHMAITYYKLLPVDIIVTVASWPYEAYFKETQADRRKTVGAPANGAVG